MRIEPSSPFFPHRLRKLDRPPAEIYFEGDLDLLSKPYISIVGARDAEAWVEEWLDQEVAPILKKRNIGVVSGGARGVDQWSHWMCCRTQNSTIAVLPSGCGAKYPASLEKFGNKNNVGFLSEYPDGTKMRKYHFYQRNRLIAALSPLTLVVQASEKSGTMITARCAIDLNSVVATLPGHPVNSRFSGNNQLLFEGAQMVRGRADLQTLLDATAGL